MDARSVMEQRVQSMICCISLVQQVMRKQPTDLQGINPLVVYSPAEALSIAWTKFKLLPKLIDKYLRAKLVADMESIKDSVNTPAMKVNLMNLTCAIEGIEEILGEEPKSYNLMRQSCIALREKVLGIVDLTSPTARSGLCH